MRPYLYLMIIAAFCACAKEKVTTPELEVTTAGTTFKAGDTVSFVFQGNPDNITFYSGEPGRKYEHRQRTTVDADLQIQFSTLVQFGKIYPNLQLMVSNDFSGIADVEHVKAATWKDVSSKAVFSAGQDNTPSGVVSLKEFADSARHKLIYIAFRYTDTNKPEGQNRWVVRTFTANSVSADNVVTPMATMATAGWKAVDFKNPAFVWAVTQAQLLMPGSKNTDDNEDWVISKGLDPTAVKPDQGIALKNISTTLPAYKYVYTRPGTYRVVFEASAVRYNGEKRITRELTLTITP
ncbi:DUF5017 domain-containing protein [Chitinophaga oryzae]|uniref:DUF5017 domain-containing protein n=1 Tax=Chitinophaga oryzae TaxID=2725414 RepID=A0AAE6ZK94_9BACT|nr:DUF5017 domain-containing protein [Chitinophaga oryzae]QJB32929.1 DUF5017 domain-containing protein [Chitinophaga oryzae]QJB39393.1 DUF5017 domain-containing protein [Chitinophaga oryzae]